MDANTARELLPDMDLEERTRLLEERTVRNEVLLEQHASEVAKLRSEQSELRADLGERLDKIYTEMSRYKGFLGGVSFLAAGAWGVVLLFKDVIVKTVTS